MKINKKNHVKIGDKVQVISGNQKGIIGTITSLFKKTSIVYINTIPSRLKQIKVSKQGEEKKQINLEIPIHISNVMIWDTKSNQPSRIGYKLIEKKKVRYFKKSGNLV